MRRYLLDSSLLAAYLNNRPSAVALIAPWIARREAATSILCYAEVIEYVKSFSNFALRHAQLKTRLLREIHPYILTFPILERYADLRRALRPPYGPGLIGDVDTLIAATALERQLTVVTMDTDFRSVPSLSVQLLPRHP